MPRASAQKKDVLVDADGDEFVDAPSEPEDIDEQDLRVYTHEQGEFDPTSPQLPRRSSTKSFVTASSVPNTTENNDSEEPQHIPTSGDEQNQSQTGGLQIPANAGPVSPKPHGERPLSDATSQGVPEFPVGGTSVDEGSTSSLLRKPDTNKPSPGLEADADAKSPARGILAKVKRRSELRSSTSEQLAQESSNANVLIRKKSNLRNLVKFDIPEDSRRATMHLKAKKAQMTVQRASSKIRRQRIKDGIVVKMERMLVRVDAAGEVPDEFDENVNQRVISRTKDKWREYMVVCRHSHGEKSDFVLQFYQTRVRFNRCMPPSIFCLLILGYSRD